MSIKSNTQYGLLFIICCLGFFLTGEISLRVIGWITDINYSLYLKDLKSSNREHGLRLSTGKYNNVVLAPNFQSLVTTSDFSVIYKTNSLGMRDKEYPPTPEAGQYRILAMGDSFTFGEGIAYGKRFTDIAESRLKNTEILNMGIPGYGIDQELLQFIEFGMPLRPHHVFVFINRVDTLRNNAPIYQSGQIVLTANAESQDKAIPPNYTKSTNEIFSMPEDYVFKSYFLAFSMYQFKLWRYRKDFAETDRRVWGGLAAEIKKDGTQNIKSEVDEYIKLRTKTIISKFLEICNTNNIKFTVVNIDPAYDLSYLQGVANLDYVDLSGDLSEAAKRFSLRFVYDLHFNEKTNQLIGDLLIDIIKKRTQN